MSFTDTPSASSERRGNDEVRTRIVSAARKLIAEQGVEASSMRAIVKEAGTSIGNAYFYFSNKNALLDAVVEAIATPIWHFSDKVQQDFPPGVERLGVSIYLNTLPAISGAIPEQGIHEGRVDHAMLDRLTHVLIRRNTNWLPALFPELSAQEIAFRVHAVLGAGKSIVIGYLQGRLEGEPHEVCERLVRWDLHAAEFDDQKIESALEAISKVRQRDDWPPGVFD